MSPAPPTAKAEVDSGQPWYVYDRHQNLMHVAMTLAEAEAWAIQHWDVVEVAGRQQVEENDYWYLLFAAPDDMGSTSRDHQARITRRDRVIAMGRDPDAPPRSP